MSELLDKAASMLAEQIKQENEEAARRLLETEAAKAREQEEDEANRQRLALGMKLIKEFVELMLQHRVPCQDLYFEKSRKLNPRYLKGGDPNPFAFRYKKIHANPTYYDYYIIEYALYGKGWVIGYPESEYSIVRDGDVTSSDGLMVMSDMTLCSWQSGSLGRMMLTGSRSPESVGIGSLSRVIIAAGIV
ncbi:MAG: hypothetical protein WCI79_03390 [Candidatus Saccharibacteria bacterium]